MISCMATKTISLEMDAYDKLKRAKRGSESFSEVVRRGRFDHDESTGARVLEEMGSLYSAGKGVSKDTLGYWDKVSEYEKNQPSVSPSPWDH